MEYCRSYILKESNSCVIELSREFLELPFSRTHDILQKTGGCEEIDPGTAYLPQDYEQNMKHITDHRPSFKASLFVSTSLQYALLAAHLFTKYIVPHTKILYLYQKIMSLW
jgi:hypothetical protein